MLKNEVTLYSGKGTYNSSIFARFDYGCSATDFALLSGVKPSYFGTTAYCSWYTRDSYLPDYDPWSEGEKNSFYINVIPFDSDNKYTYGGDRTIGIRPVIYFDDISDITNNPNVKIIGDMIVEYGEYPQFKVDSETEETLNEYRSTVLSNETGKVYTTNYNTKLSFIPKVHKEYEFYGKKYIYVKAGYFNDEYNKKTVCFNDGTETRKNKYVWIEVKPIVWYVNEKAKFMISKYCLTSGVRFSKDYKYRGNFKDSEMYLFLNKYFANEIISEKNSKEIQIKEEKNNQKESERIIKEIKNYLDYSYDKEKIMEEVFKIIKDNNEKINAINESERNNKIELTLYNSDLIYKESIQKLNSILTELKECYERQKAYYEMLDIIEVSKKIINGKIIDKADNNIINIINGIITTSIKFLNIQEKDEIKKDLMDILNKYDEEIHSYLDMLSKGDLLTEKKYDSLISFEKSIREYLQIVLIKVRLKQNEDIVSDCLKNTIELINLKNEKANIQQIDKCLDDIKNIKESIIDKIKTNPDYYSYYQEELNRITSNDLDMSNLQQSLINLYGELYELNNKMEKEKERNKKFIKW